MIKTNVSTNARRQKGFRARQNEAGLAFVGVWVPLEDVDDIRERAKRLRVMHTAAAEIENQPGEEK